MEKRNSSSSSLTPPSNSTLLPLQTPPSSLPATWGVRKRRSARVLIAANLPETSRLEDENHGAILPSRSAFKKAHDLPDGWVMEEVLRSTGKRTDKFYYEPGTGCKFRSKAAVERHLMTELNENRPLSILHQHPTVSKRKTSREDDWFDDRPPLKVNWALAEGNAWNPSIGDALISESVKLTWSKRIHVVYEH